MSHFGRNIRPHVDAELRAARDAERSGDTSSAFARLERAQRADPWPIRSTR